MTDWHYYNEKGEKITVTGGHLKRLAKAGLITPGTLIETEDGKKAPARKVKGLTFAETVQPKDVPSLNPFTVDPPAAANSPIVHTSTVIQRTNQTALPHATPQSIPVPITENNNGSSWQVTVIGVALILVVGGIACAVLFTTSPQRESSASAEQAMTLPIESSMVPLALEDIIEQVERSVARIEGPGGSGSGFLVRPQILATNYHVIERLFLEQVEVFFPSATGRERGPFSTRLLYADARRDIAFLRVESPLPVLPLANSHQFRRGQEVIAIGSPGNLENAVNLGVLSSELEIEGQKYWQLGMSINPGNSGGPILDREGNVIGIATLKSAIQEGIAFCIPVTCILEALSTTERLTELQRSQNNSQHRARVSLNLLALVTLVCLDSMDDIDIHVSAALRSGRSATAGLNEVAEVVERRMQIVEFIFLDRLEREFDTIKQDTNLPWEFRRKLTEFHANSMEIKSYVDRPRGTVESYRRRMNELAETGLRLLRELRSLLGLPAE